MINQWLPSKFFHKVKTCSSKVGSLQLWQQKSIFSMHYKSSQKNAKFCSTFSASEMSKSFRFMEHFWLVFEWWSIFISQTKVFFPLPCFIWMGTYCSLAQKYSSRDNVMRNFRNPVSILQYALRIFLLRIWYSINCCEVNVQACLPPL